MDARVQEVQLWLGETYPAYFFYDEDGKNSGTLPVQPDGITGGTTVKALIMALQIHKGLSPVDGIWGNATSSACPLVNRNTTDEIVVRIVQGAFLCKGYNPGPFDGIFGNSTANAIKKFKENLGMPGDEELTAEYFKSLLSTDPTVLVGTGSAKIRSVQQYLNGNYYSLYKSNLGFLPTGGVYDRKTGKALIYAIQKEIKSTPDGLLGPATFAALPIVKTGYSNVRVVKILQAALICHNYDVDFDGVYEALLAREIEAFQRFMCLDLDPAVVLGEVNRRTWGALLWSKGDTDRKPNACDCSYRIMNQNLANALYAQGFRYIGRYLTNVDPNNDAGKKMSVYEINILLNAGLKIFPIFQESPRTPVSRDFNKEQGIIDAKKAMDGALKLGIPKGTIIYFALDCDMTETDLKNYGIPYFEGINNYFADNFHYYKIGVYGARNTCITLAKKGYSISSFVSNMSTGYSGNLGFLMPENWAFEQYYEKKNYELENFSFDLDYDMASGRDEGFSALNVGIDESAYIPPYYPTKEEVSNIKPILDLVVAIKWLEETYYTVKGITNPNAEQKVNCALAVLDYLYQYQYQEYLWEFISPTDEEFVNTVNTSFSTNNRVTELYPHIRVTEEGEAADKLTTRAKVLTDGYLGILELPHLAVVIKCYLKSLVPGSWSAWAGDFASAVKETYVNADEKDSNAYFDVAKDRIGEMEADTVSITEARLFNYCDLIADIDGYAICQLMQESTSAYRLSECIEAYYSDWETFYKRYHYFQPIIGFKSWRTIEIKESILKHFSPVLKFRFAREADQYPGADEMTALALALNIIYWSRETNVIE